MDSVFIVFVNYDYDVDHFEGVFSTKELAEQRVKELNESLCGEFAWCDGYKIDEI